MSSTNESNGGSQSASLVQAPGRPLTTRRHPGYDHSHHFIARLTGEHLAWHAEGL